LKVFFDPCSVVHWNTVQCSVQCTPHTALLQVNQQRSGCDCWHFPMHSCRLNQFVRFWIYLYCSPVCSSCREPVFN
jgi:hypothetical protein